MIGDYNVNLLNIDNHLLILKLEIFHSYLFYMRYRVNCDSATLIHNIYYNNFGNDNLFCGHIVHRHH